MSDTLKRYVLHVPEFPDEPFMAEHPNGAWIEHRDHREIVKGFERDIAALQSDIEAQIRIASEEATRAANWKRMLQAVTSEIDDREYSEPWRLIENAPGHGHEKPGVWDQDNGKKAGKPCAWCLVWNEARAALARKEP